MHVIVAIACLLMAAESHAQIFGFTPQQIQYLDARYAKTGDLFSSTGLTTSTIFGAAGNVHGIWNSLTYTETDPVFVPWLISFSATSVIPPVVTADGVTITNNGSGQLSVPLYDSNVFARLAYRQRTRDSLNDYLPGHINDSTLGEMTNGGPLALTLQDLLD